MVVVVVLENPELLTLFQGGNRIRSFPSVSSLSDYSMWTS